LYIKGRHAIFYIINDNSIIYSISLQKIYEINNHLVFRLKFTKIYIFMLYLFKSDAIILPGTKPRGLRGAFAFAICLMGKRWRNRNQIE